MMRFEPETKSRLYTGESGRYVSLLSAVSQRHVRTRRCNSHFTPRR